MIETVLAIMAHCDTQVGPQPGARPETFLDLIAPAMVFGIAFITCAAGVWAGLKVSDLLDYLDRRRAERRAKERLP